MLFFVIHKVCFVIILVLGFQPVWGKVANKGYNEMEVLAVDNAYNDVPDKEWQKNTRNRFRYMGTILFVTDTCFEKNTSDSLLIYTEGISICKELNKKILKIHFLDSDKTGSTTEEIHSDILNVIERNIRIIGGVVLLFLSFFGVLFVGYRKNEKINQEKQTVLFDKINNLMIDQSEAEKELSFVKSSTAIDNENEVCRKSKIDEKQVKAILSKLEELQEKKYYLRQDCTLHNLAKKLKTNTAYLSKIINSELGKSFSAYINELRINYAIVELERNSRLRSYSISAIADEIGYKSPDSFSKYFKEFTGVSPSVYIRKMEKNK